MHEEDDDRDRNSATMYSNICLYRIHNEARFANKVLSIELDKPNNDEDALIIKCVSTSKMSVAI